MRRSTRIKAESLEEQTEHVLEESRMVLPGIQALFGFQLITVFNESFGAKLSAGEQRLHLIALGMVTCAVALVLCPAAYHRQAHPQSTSAAFTQFASWCLTAGMFALMIGLTLDVYVVSAVILGRGLASAAVGLGTLLVFLALWFVLPRRGIPGE